MDINEVTTRYMAEYNKVVEAYESKKISNLVDEINVAISKSDMANVNTIYNKISEWNDRVSNIQGARIVLTAQYRSSKFPSVSEFLIVFDNINKEWRFNTEAD